MGMGVVSREFSLFIVCSSLVTLHPITLQNGWGEDSATAHSDDANRCVEAQSEHHF